MATAQQKQETEHLASAKILNIAISTKHGIELSRALRYKNTSYAKRFLENVVSGASPVPFRRFKGDVGHKAGMAAGRFAQKAAKEFLRLVKSVEANAQDKGLDTSNLKIVKILTNKASIPQTGGRQRSATKRSHIEIAVKEGKAVEKKVPAKKAKSESPKTEVKSEPEVAGKVAPETAEKKGEEAPVEETKEEVKAQNEEVPVINKEEKAEEETAPADNTNESTEEAPAEDTTEEKPEEQRAEETNDTQESTEEENVEKTTESTESKEENNEEKTE